MSKNASPRSSRTLSLALWLQGALCVGALGFVLSPTPGNAALYLPLTGATTGEALAWSERAGVRLVGPGPLPGSLVVTGGNASLALSAMSGGALLISAPASLCGAPVQQRLPR